MGKKLSYSAFVDRKTDDAMEIEMANGDVFTIADPALWPDEVMALANLDDNIGVARALIGEENYPRFIAAGGSANTLMGLIAEAKGVTVGESSASSA